jgi:hypothetical protein
MSSETPYGLGFQLHSHWAYFGNISFIVFWLGIDGRHYSSPAAWIRGQFPRNAAASSGAMFPSFAVAAHSESPAQLQIGSSIFVKESIERLIVAAENLAAE